MTLEEFLKIDWHRGNTVRLTNGKEYPVKKVRKHWLLLYSVEYSSFFIVNHLYIDCRTSDASVPTRGELIRAQEAERQKAIAEGRPVPEFPPIPGVPVSVKKSKAAKAEPVQTAAPAKPAAPVKPTMSTEPVKPATPAAISSDTQSQPRAAETVAAAPAKPKRKRIIIRKPVAVERVTPHTRE